MIYSSGFIIMLFIQSSKYNMHIATYCMVPMTDGKEWKEESGNTIIGER